MLDRPWQGFAQNDELLALLQESILLTGQEDHEPRAVVEVKDSLGFSSYVHRWQQQGDEDRLPELKNRHTGVAPPQGFLMEAVGGMGRRSSAPHRAAPVCILLPKPVPCHHCWDMQDWHCAETLSQERLLFLHLNTLQLPKVGAMETRGKGISATVKCSCGQSAPQKG